jgi:cytochrome c-type biogenesis protein CcmF
MTVAHFGMAVFIAGVTVVGSFQSENDVRMEVGSSASVGGHDFKLESMALVQGPNYTSAQAVISVSKAGQPVSVLRPERRIYKVSRMALTEVALDRGFTRDLYVALGAPVSSTAWSVRLHYKPLVNWIWGGCFLMALGGGLALADKRYRARRWAAAPVLRGLEPA